MDEFDPERIGLTQDEIDVICRKLARCPADDCVCWRGSLEHEVIGVLGAARAAGYEISKREDNDAG